MPTTESPVSKIKSEIEHTKSQIAHTVDVLEDRLDELKDWKSLTQRYPMQAVAVSLGVGFLLAKILMPKHPPDIKDVMQHKTSQLGDIVFSTVSAFAVKQATQWLANQRFAAPFNRSHAPSEDSVL